MRFHTALATGADLEAACREVAATLRARAGAEPFDMCFVFASPRYGLAVDRLPILLHEQLGCRTLVGCSAAAAVADSSQFEAGHHGIVVCAGRLPGTRIDAVLLGNGDLPSPDAPPAAWRALLPESELPRAGMVVLAEPFHCDVRALLAGLDFGFPALTKVGGIASGSRHPDGHALFLGRNTYRAGAIVVSFAGDVELTTVSARGCRPFGRVGRITRSDQRRLLAVDDRPARAFVEEQLEQLDDQEREVAQRSPLLLAITPDPFAAQAPGDGEFLVCNILGVDQTGNLVLAEHLPIGRRVRLMMRDEGNTADDLRQRLQRSRPIGAAGALLFRCLGRDGADHEVFAAVASGVPVAGFHCNGEIAPIGGATHLQAFTAAFALFRPRSGR